MFCKDIYARTKIRLALFALLVFFCGAPLAAEAAPLAVKISWGENTDGKDPGHITDKALAIYNQEGVLQTASDSITEEAYTSIALDPVTYMIYTATYALEPGSYRWEGKAGGVVIGGGPFDVADKNLTLYLERASIYVKPLEDGTDSGDRGFKLDLYDYRDTNKTTPLQPYYVEPYDPEKPELGIIGKRYLVLDRAKSAAYNYRLSPIEETFDEDGKPLYIKEGTLYIAGTNTSPSAKKKLMTQGFFYADGSTVGAGNPATSGRITLPDIKSVIFKVTPGADLRLYEKTGSHYAPFTEYYQKSKTTEGGYDVYTYVLERANFHYEAGGGEFIMDYMVFCPPPESVVPGDYTITVDLERSDARDWSAVDYDANWQDADMYLNISDDRYLELKPGDSFDLHPLRVWQAVRDVMTNYHTEPDYRLEVLGADGGSVTLDSLNGTGTKASNETIEIEMTGSRGRERYKITGKEQGLAVIKITYGGLTYSRWLQTGRNYCKNTDISQELFYPSEPSCTAVVVVNVTPSGAADNASLSTNIGEREYDTIYFAAPDTSAVYTFAPETADGGDVHVRVHKPLHNEGVTWNEDWTDYGSKASGASFGITLCEGYNIVEVSGGGAKKYHSIYAKPAKIEITNLTHPESDGFTVGDEVNINIKGLKVPVQKLGGIYNPGIRRDPETAEYSSSGCFLYDADGRTLQSTFGQYDMKLGMDLRYVIQEEETALRNGRIDCSHYGSPLGYHRFIGTDVPEDLYANENSGIYSTLPDIAIKAKAVPKPEEPETLEDVDTSDPKTPAVIVTLDPGSYKVDNGVGTVSVPDGTLVGAVDRAVEVADEAGGTEPTIVIKAEVAAADGVKEVRVEIPVDDLETVAESAVENVKIATAVGEVTLNTKAIEDLVAQADLAEAATVEVAIEHMETLEDSTLTEAQKTALSDDVGKVREVYDVSVLIGDEKKNIETGGRVTIGLPYKLDTGEVSEGVRVVYVREDGLTERMNGARYNQARELAVFTTNHLSIYAVTYEPDAAPAGDQQGGCAAGAGVSGLVLLAFAIATRRRAK